MTAYVGTRQAGTLQLPVAMEWSFHYTVGVPCDSFSITIPWVGELPVFVELWDTFRAEHQGAVVFSGIIDECVSRQGEQGATIEITGRGYAARLLDNEALGQDYVTATLEDVLKDHVYPFGVQVAERVDLFPVTPFQVDSGTSAWGVLYDFCRYYGNVMPRFNKAGQLILKYWDKKVGLKLTDGTPLTSLTHRQKRYGVCSQVWVRDRVTQEVQKVSDSTLLAQGYVKQDVITMPGKSTTSAMTYNGSYRLAKSKGERLRIEAVVPTLEFLEPGSLVEICRSNWFANGSYVLLEVEVGVSARGAYTKMELGDPNMML